MYFFHIQDFAKGEINEGALVTPTLATPWTNLRLFVQLVRHKTISPNAADSEVSADHDSDAAGVPF